MLGAPFFQPGYVCGYYAPGISGTVNTFHVIPVLYAWDDEADSIVLDAALFAVSPRTPPPTIRLLLVLSSDESYHDEKKYISHRRIVS